MKTHNTALFGLLALLLPIGAQAQTTQTETLRDLQSAYQGEAQASAFYKDCARQALRDGYPDVAKLFRAAAFSEAIHRDNYREAIRALGAKPERLSADRPRVKGTRDNLKDSVAKEREQSGVTYPESMRRAHRSGVPAAERAFHYALHSEKEHARLFQAALENLDVEHHRDNPRTFFFVCRTCAMTRLSSVPPSYCPACHGSPAEFIKVH